MQLQMTAPMDIGLEQQDLSLRTGQEDTFELGTKDGNLRRMLRRKLIIDDEESDVVISSEDEAGGEVEEVEIMSQLGDEKERNLGDLEAELEDMYETYQDRLRERDAKSRVRAARNLERDEWHGIESQNSESDADEEEETQKGGWESMQKAKLQDSDSDDFTSESEEESKARTKKRTRFEKDTSSTQKRRRLSPDGSDVKATTSAAAKLWFSQDVFGNVRGLDQIDDSEDDVDGSKSDETDEKDSKLSDVEYDEVRLSATCVLQLLIGFHTGSCQR